jgi:hypothetical protein
LAVAEVSACLFPLVRLNTAFDPVRQRKAADLQAHGADTKGCSLRDDVAVMLEVNRHVSVLCEYMCLELILHLCFERAEWAAVNWDGRLRLKIQERPKDIQGSDLLDVFFVFRVSHDFHFCVQCTTVESPIMENGAYILKFSSASNQSRYFRIIAK